MTRKITHDHLCSPSMLTANTGESLVPLLEEVIQSKWGLAYCFPCYKAVLRDLASDREILHVRKLLNTGLLELDFCPFILRKS